MDDFVPKPMPELPLYRIRLRPPMTDEEQAAHDRQYQQQVAVALKDYSNEEVNTWLAELRAKERIEVASSMRKQRLLDLLPPEQRALAEFLANHLAQQYIAERAEEGKKLTKKKENNQPGRE